MKKLTKQYCREEVFLTEMFDSISEVFTPDFSSKDWYALWQKSKEGDVISNQMMRSLWDSKVRPYLPIDLENTLTKTKHKRRNSYE